MFNVPASTCFNGANDARVAGFTAVAIGAVFRMVSALAHPIKANSAADAVSTAAPRRRRRSWSISCGIGPSKVQPAAAR